MKKNLLVLCCSLLLLSCKSNEPLAITGSWVDAETEMTGLSVTESEGALWFNFYDGKFKVTDNKIVTIKDMDYPIRYYKERNVLSISGKEFIPESESVKNKFIGTWQGPDQIVFEISKLNGGLKWIVIDNGRLVNYYPKKIDNGFSFTFNEQELKFFINGNCIEVSNGDKYCKA